MKAIVLPLLIVGVIFVTGMAWLLVALWLESYLVYRKRNDLRIRDDRMRRYGLTSELPTRRVNK